MIAEYFVQMSRRDTILLTVDFNLRTKDDAPTPKSRRDDTYEPL